LSLQRIIRGRRATRGERGERSERARDATARRVVGSIALAVAVLTAACHDPPKGAALDAALAGPDTARARALANAEVPMPSRAEAVAIADALAFAASNAPAAEHDALVMLAANVRARSFHFDRADADAREALELYASVASRGGADGCAADRKRALLAAEITNSGASLYRELYLAARRQARIASEAKTEPSACVLRLERDTAAAIAYRPEGEAMRALEAEAARATVPTRVAVAPSGSDTAPAPAAPAAPTGDVVISPKEEQASKDPVKITSIEPFGTEDGARVVINLSGVTTFQVGTLPADDKGKDARIYLDLSRATAKGVKHEINVGGALRRVRVGAQKDGTRVVLDLAASLFRRVFYLPDPFRVVVDVSTKPPRPADAPGGGARTVSRIVIDPGHGGNDSGAVGPTGLREKDVTLDIAHRVAPLLAHELKVETLLTRDDDTYVPLDLRTARANAFHADLFVSIHCNAAENASARGVQTFVLDEAKETSAARIAAWENTPKSKPGSSIVPKQSGELSLIVKDLAVGDLSARSRHFADLVQRSALASLGQRYPDTKDQGIKTAGFFVLVGADMPAALFETSFISNTDDEARLATADYRQKLADAILNAVRAYKEGK
jgi:N-acetylmuramoyl-L-alanine amidase